MQQFNKIARVFLSPPILLIVVWSVLLAGVAFGPIDYSSIRPLSLVGIVATGLFLFSLSSWVGARNFAFSLQHWPDMSAGTLKGLNVTIGVASAAGLIGIALIAFDRTILSGVSNGAYSALLRCAPDLVDYIEIKRTALLYVGYLTFSFGFASLALFLLKGEEVSGWAAYLAQLSIISPVGYALLYSGRMPILLMIALIISVVMARLARKLPPFPSGHYLIMKMVVLVVLFGIYSNAMWSSRQNFCEESNGLVIKLRAEIEQGARGIDAVMLSARAKDLKSLPISRNESAFARFDSIMQQKWHASPRQYVLSAVDSGYLSPRVAIALLSNYYYLTHGVRILDVIWIARAQLSPLWGVYEIGVLSPILRVFFPDNQLLSMMNSQHRAVDIYGFFPTVWGAAFIDFGAVGAIIYVLMWGFAVGWSYYGTRHSMLATPPLLLTFTLASILLSPIQGPFGVANSALVLLSMLLLGALVDLWTLRSRSRVTLPPSFIQS